MSAAGAIAVRRPTPQLLATILGAAVLVLLAAAVPLATLIHQVDVANFGSGVVIVPFGMLGAVVARRQPRNPLGWLMLVAALCVLIGTDTAFYLVLHYRLHHAGPLASVAVFLEQSWSVALVLFGVLLLLFPDGQLPSPRWRVGFWIYLAAGAVWVVGGYAISAVAIATHDIQVGPAGEIAAVSHPTGIAIVWQNPGWWFPVLLAAAFLSGASHQLRDYQRATGERRLQLKWLLTGATVSGVCIGISLFTFPTGSTIWQAITDLGVVGPATLPICMGVAILKYRLYEIDRLISRSLSYAVVTGLLIAVYVGMVALTTRALPLSSSVGVAASTLAAVALFTPLRRRVQRIVDRRFNRTRYDAEATVAAFTARLRDSVDLDTVRADLVDVVNRAVEATHVSVWVR
jgi:hypothetical protein